MNLGEISPDLVEILLDLRLKERERKGAMVDEISPNLAKTIRRTRRFWYGD